MYLKEIKVGLNFKLIQSDNISKIDRFVNTSVYAMEYKGLQ
jgi:hypothetical protein